MQITEANTDNDYEFGKVSVNLYPIEFNPQQDWDEQQRLWDTIVQAVEYDYPVTFRGGVALHNCSLVDLSTSPSSLHDKIILQVTVVVDGFSKLPISEIIESHQSAVKGLAEAERLKQIEEVDEKIAWLEARRSELTSLSE